MKRCRTESDPRTVLARNLRWLSVTGLIIITLSFVIYILNLLPQRVPIETVTQNWHLSSREFIEKLELDNGWNWIGSLRNSDVLCLASIVFMAIGTPVSIATVSGVFFLRGNRHYGVIAFLQFLVLCFAASGIAGVGL